MKNKLRSFLPQKGQLLHQKRQISILAVSHSISLTNKHLTLTFSPLPCWCQIFSQAFSRSPSSVALTSSGCEASWLSQHSSVWGVHSSQHPLPPKNFFPQQLFSPLPNSLHCITFNDFLTSPLKQTRKPPSHPYPSLHTFPLPSCYSSLSQGNILNVTASWVPYNSHFSSLTNSLLSLSVVLVLYPFPMSLQPVCSVNQDIRMLC